MHHVNGTHLTVLAMFHKDGLIEIYDLLMCIMFIMKETNSNLAECQREYQHQRMHPMEYGSVHYKSKAMQTLWSFLTVCKIQAVGKVAATLLFAEFVLVIRV
jgi:hypothetical protein